MDYYVCFYIGGSDTLQEQRIRNVASEREAIRALLDERPDALLAECSIPGEPAVYPVQ